MRSQALGHGANSELYSGNYSEFNPDRRKVDAGGNVCSTSDGLAIAGHAVGLSLYIE